MFPIVFYSILKATVHRHLSSQKGRGLGWMSWLAVLLMGQAGTAFGVYLCIHDDLMTGISPLFFIFHFFHFSTVRGRE